uniref:Ig-like domain-containing protein n=1 Tax=Esox lucius TaxID=8010 RepID=A0AAY5KHA8_ESOLU
MWRMGESVTLLCPIISTVVGHVAWFKQVNRSEPVCISTMYTSHSSTVDYYLENRHFEMYSNNTTIFLNITKVEIADSGLYFCGFFTNTKHMVFFGQGTLLVLKGEQLCRYYKHFAFCISQFSVLGGHIHLFYFTGADLNSTVTQQPVSESVNPGDSVTLNCTINTGTCEGEHSVYWFRHDSGESPPGIISTNGDRSGQLNDSIKG